MIKLNNVSKQYNNGIFGIKSFSYSFDKGKMYLLKGHSGSGKSTLLNIIGCLSSPTHGDILYDDKMVQNLSDNDKSDLRLKKVGFVFQNFHLNAHLKLYENIMLPMLINEEYKTKDEMKKKAMELINMIGLFHRINHYPGELSGGEQQRVAIARAMANNPDFILADEPTGNLDSKNEIIIFEELKKLAQSGKGVLVVSHNDAVIDFADKIYIMKDCALEEKKNAE